MAASPLTAHLSEEDAIKRLNYIHSQLSLTHGSFSEEYPEQVMSAMFISENDKVLELGGNAGRNSCVIGTILNRSENLVVSESDPSAVRVLIANRDHNKLHFHVEDSALSQVSHVQAGWVTFPSETVPPGHFRVKTITYDELKEKYGIAFNVFVADCEGALYFIFQDDESILEDVEMIIVENDYHHLVHYETVRNKFIAHGFQLIYNKAGCWGPCSNMFYQV
jgi:hypothetical protein